MIIHFSPRTLDGGRKPFSLSGVPWHLPNIRALPCHLHNPIRTLLPHQPQGLGQPREVQDQCHLPPNLDWGICSGGQGVWPLYNVGTPYQARAPTMEEAVNSWPHYPPLGLTGPMPWCSWTGTPAMHHSLGRGTWASWWRGTSRATCRRVSQLEVCQLLSSGSQVVYPVGLNGCEVPVIAFPPGSQAKGVNLLRDKSIYLKVDILQSIAEGPELKALPLSSHSSSILITSPIRPPPPKVEGEISMTMEVRELLSWAVLDTSEHISGSSTPKRQEPMVLVTPLPTKLEDFP